MTHQPFATLRRTLGPFIEPLYRFEINRRNARYDLLIGVHSLPLPVISVGNLTTGGTGKTPFVVWLCSGLMAAGRRPLIAMRGYKANATGQSDEAELYRRLLPGVPVVANPRRFAAVTRWLAQHPGAADCVVLDDGFQHRKVRRDCDIVLLDATVDLSAERMLPTGNLRESVEGLARADLIVITHAEAVQGPLAAGTHWSGPLLTRLGRTTDAVASHVWHGLRDAQGVLHPPSDLQGKRVLAVCAIGNPAAFVRQVQIAVGVEATPQATAESGPASEQSPKSREVCSIVLPDHDPYLPPTIERIIREAAAMNANMIVTTAKDFTKLGREIVNPDRWPAPLMVAELGLSVSGGDELLAKVLGSLGTPTPN